MSGLVKTFLALWLFLMGVAQGVIVYPTEPPLGNFFVKTSEAIQESPPETQNRNRDFDRFAYDCPPETAYCHNDPVNHVDLLGLRKKEIIASDPKLRFRKNANGEWMVRIELVETGGWGNRSDLIAWRWESVKSDANRFRLLGYREFTEEGGILTSGAKMWVEASRATGWDENAMKEGTLIAGGGMITLAAGPAALIYGTSVEAGAGLMVYGGHALRTAWAHGGVRVAGYGAMGAVGGGTGYGLLTDQQFRGEFITLEQTSGIPGEGLVLFGRGLQMAGRDAKAALHGFDFLSFSASTNRRLPVQLLPEPMYVVPPSGRSSSGGDDLEAQLNRLYQQGLELQKRFQTKPPASLIPPTSYPNTVMMDIRGLQPLPGGRTSYDPLKLGEHGPFDWAEYSPILIQYVNGQPYIVNGMTRIENALRSGITHLPVETLR